MIKISNGSDTTEFSNVIHAVLYYIEKQKTLRNHKITSDNIEEFNLFYKEITGRDRIENKLKRVVSSFRCVKNKSYYYTSVSVMLIFAGIMLASLINIHNLYFNIAFSTAMISAIGFLLCIKYDMILVEGEIYDLDRLIKYLENTKIEAIDLSTQLNDQYFHMLPEQDVRSTLKLYNQVFSKFSNMIDYFEKNK